MQECGARANGRRIGNVGGSLLLAVELDVVFVAIVLQEEQL